jgi:hypothetical protein
MPPESALEDVVAYFPDFGKLLAAAPPEADRSAGPDIQAQAVATAPARQTAPL